MHNEPFTIFAYPGGIAGDSHENIYIINAWKKKCSSGQLASTDGIAVDASSNMYVVDKQSNLILKFTSDEKFITKRGLVTTTVFLTTE